MLQCAPKPPSSSSSCSLCGPFVKWNGSQVLSFGRAGQSFVFLFFSPKNSSPRACPLSSWQSGSLAGSPKKSGDGDCGLQQSLRESELMKEKVLRTPMRLREYSSTKRYSAFFSGVSPLLHGVGLTWNRPRPCLCSFRASRYFKPKTLNSCESR